MPGASCHNCPDCSARKRPTVKKSNSLEVSQNQRLRLESPVECSAHLDTVPCIWLERRFPGRARTLGTSLAPGAVLAPGPLELSIGFGWTLPAPVGACPGDKPRDGVAPAERFKRLDIAGPVPAARPLDGRRGSLFVRDSPPTVTCVPAGAAAVSPLGRRLLSGDPRFVGKLVGDETPVPRPDIAWVPPRGRVWDPAPPGVPAPLLPGLRQGCGWRVSSEGLLRKPGLPRAEARKLSLLALELRPPLAVRLLPPPLALSPLPAPRDAMAAAIADIPPEDGPPARGAEAPPSDAGLNKSCTSPEFSR